MLDAWQSKGSGTQTGSREPPAGDQALECCVSAHTAFPCARAPAAPAGAVGGGPSGDAAAVEEALPRPKELLVVAVGSRLAGGGILGESLPPARALGDRVGPFFDPRALAGGSGDQRPF
jgi:hypothetical protein